MNKFYALLFLLLSAYASCDNLLTAIDQHNAKKVSMLLQQKQYDSVNYTQYLKAAQKALEKCRDDLYIQKIKSEISPNYAAAALILFIIVITYQLYKSCSTEIENPLLQNDILKRDVLRVLISCLVSGICFGIERSIYKEDPEMTYQNALQIQQLLSQLLPITK